MLLKLRYAELLTFVLANFIELQPGFDGVHWLQATCFQQPTDRTCKGHLDVNHSAAQGAGKCEGFWQCAGN